MEAFRGVINSVSIAHVNSPTEGPKCQPRKRGLTSQHHPAEQRVVPGQCAAVPAVVSELMLALPDPLFGSLADGLHQVRVFLAQLALLVHQAGNVADHAGPQRSAVPGMDTIQQEIEESWSPRWK